MVLIKRKAYNLIQFIYFNNKLPNYLILQDHERYKLSDEFTEVSEEAALPFHQNRQRDAFLRKFQDAVEKNQSGRVALAALGRVRLVTSDASLKDCTGTRWLTDFRRNL